MKDERTPMGAITHYCLECCCFSRSEVDACPSVKCPLHPFRKGRNPYRAKRVLSEEQRQALAETLARARESKVSTLC